MPLDLDIPVRFAGNPTSFWFFAQVQQNKQQARGAGINAS